MLRNKTILNKWNYQTKYSKLNAHVCLPVVISEKWSRTMNSPCLISWSGDPDGLSRLCRKNLLRKSDGSHTLFLWILYFNALPYDFFLFYFQKFMWSFFHDSQLFLPCGFNLGKACLVRIWDVKKRKLSHR